jgi:hypothetical protein
MDISTAMKEIEKCIKQEVQIDRVPVKVLLDYARNKLEEDSIMDKNNNRASNSSKGNNRRNRPQGYYVKP